jgi:cupin fold WbuC family metalloprotein
MKRISSLATRSEHRELACIDRALVEAKIEDARRNPRRREIHCFHESDDEPLHRMLNAVEPGTYIRPHRHHFPPKAEAVLVLSGALGIVIFDEGGAIRSADCVRLGGASGVWGVDLRPGVWHTFLALATGTVMFEVKPGPYQRASDKDFAAWAPLENTPEAETYLAELEAAFRLATER